MSRLELHARGFYSEDRTVYTIRNMFPRRPLRNFLWNEKFIMNVDQFGFGPSWHADQGVKTFLCPPLNSRLFFLQDEQELWAANRNYERRPFDDFQTEVGFGFSRIYSKYRGLSFSLCLFVPREGSLECWAVELRNETDATRKFSLFAYAGCELNALGEAGDNLGVFDEKLGGIYLSYQRLNTKSDRLCVFQVADVKPTAYETSDRRFRGVYGRLQAPEGVLAGKLASQGTTFDLEMCAAQQFDLELQAGETKKLHFLYGLATSLEAAVETRVQRLSADRLQREFEAVVAEAKSGLQRITVNTPDEDINTSVNVWLKRQIHLGKTWGRTYSRGFRDIMQDSTAFMGLDPATAAEKIADCLTHQYPNGNTQRQWQMFLAHPYRDGASWLPAAVAGYVKETGDLDFLERKAAYCDSDESGSVLDHCKRGMDFLFDGLGEHGLCLWGGGDWNDSIETAGLLGKGESVWLTEATIVAAEEYAALLERIGRPAEAAETRKKAEALRVNLREHAWDKDHFICGYNDWGEKIGSYENKEGRIFLNMQTWGVLAGAAPDAAALMDLIERELSCPFGYVLNKPAYRTPDRRIGRVTFFTPGCFENGAAYNHGATFKIAADCRLGRGRLAYETVKKMLPTNPKNPPEHSGIEPYAISNMYLGPENLRAGEAPMAWITGTAGWLFRCLVEYMLGVRADWDGLAVRPCLPEHWRDLRVRRLFRGAMYDIRILNPKGLQTGKVKITADGQKLQGDILPAYQDGNEHGAEVEIE
jgi:cellobiose phosphorylase